MRYLVLCAIAVSPFTVEATRIQCQSIAAVERTIADDRCESFEDAADACWSNLNREFYRLKDNPKSSTEERIRRKQLLSEDYKNGLVQINRYLDVVSSLGEGRGCLDQIPAIKVYIEETESDINDIARF